MTYTPEGGFISFTGRYFTEEESIAQDSDDSEGRINTMPTEINENRKRYIDIAIEDNSSHITAEIMS